MRKAQPDCLRHFFKILRCPDGQMNLSDCRGRKQSATLQELAAILNNVAGYSSNAAVDTATNAIDDGFLIVGKEMRSSKKLRREERYRLPLPEDVSASSYDFYCYECHLPGMMEHCRECTRSFHRMCCPKNLWQAMYMRSNSQELSNISSFADLTISPTTSNDVRVSPSHTFLKSMKNRLDTNTEKYNAPEKLSKQNSNNCNVSEEDVDIETECEEDLVDPKNGTGGNCSTVVTNVFNKSLLEEHLINDDLCVACQLLKCPDLRNLPNTHADKLCRLIGYAYERNRQEGELRDTITDLKEMNISKTEFHVAKRLLHISSTHRFSMVKENIEKRKYNSPMEFFVDLLDIQHSVGVYFGHKSAEFKSFNLFLRNIFSDLLEIKRCPDCFLYSNEKHMPIWYPKPCIPHLESVLVECSDLKYQPAKVIRVVPNFKYEVILIGTAPTLLFLTIFRALKSLWSQQRILRLKCKKLKKPNKSSKLVLTFYAPQLQLKKKADTETSFMPKKKRSGNAKEPFNRAFSIKSDNPSSRISPNCLKTKNLQPNPIESDNRRCDLKNLTESINALRKECEQMRNTSDEYALKNRVLEAEKEDIKTVIEKLELNREFVKNTLWCKWCLEKARYECCFKAAYCSATCQESHWLDGHYKDCINGGI
ncbi:uncharacterized protein ACN427_001620 [Glossina fuscipes fuscipes]